MRHMSFWIFHSLLLFGAVLALVTLLRVGSEQTFAGALQQASVLADTTHTFSRFDGSAPDPNDIFDEVNRVRAEAGVEPLLANQELETIAQERARDMLENDYYAHANPLDGQVFSDLLQRDAVAYQSACENLNMAFYAQPRALTQDWLRSTAGHRECLLDPAMSQAGYTVVKVPIDNGRYAYVAVAIHLQR